MQSAIDLHRCNKKRRSGRQIVCSNVLVPATILTRRRRKVNRKFCPVDGFVENLQLFSANEVTKMYDTSNFSKPIDKSRQRGYNGIVNSKGAADKLSVALFFLVYSANSIHKGVYEVSGLLHPFDNLCCNNS